MLEPYDGKLSRTVLRGAWDRKVLGPTRSYNDLMRKPLVIIISALVCLLLFVTFVAFSWPSGSLRYEGKHLSEWLILVQSPSQQESDRAT
jgi:hypothetical protein